MSTEVPPGSVDSRSGEPLELVESLATALEGAGVDYIHWKSNEHLGAAVRGETDLDLLVSRSHRETFEANLDTLGFLPLQPQRGRHIPGVHGFLGMDHVTTTLVHLDVHYELVLGERLVKNHRLPLEDWLLGDSSELEGMPTPRPVRELLLLYVRVMLKTSNRQILRAIVKGGSPLPARVRREAAWLRERVDPSEIVEAVRSSGIPLDARAVLDFHTRGGEDRFDWRWALAGRRSVLTAMRRYRRLPWYRSVPRKLWLRFRSSPTGKRLGLAIPRRRLGHPAPLIAVVGADGAGKTRVVSDLATWLGTRVVVDHVYFGQPKGGGWFKLLNKPGSVARNRSGGAAKVAGAIAGVSDGLKWVALGRARRRAAGTARHKGIEGDVVFAERFPLPQFFGMKTPMDGPRLQERGGLFARWELAQYERVGLPDLTIVLRAELGILRSRKLDLTLEEHVPKVEAVAALTPGPGLVVIDAGQPYEEVLLEAKRHVWDVLIAGR